MSNITPEPDDILGTRPAGGGRAGVVQLLRAGLSLLRQHGLRAWGLSVLTSICLLAISQLVFAPLSIGFLVTRGQDLGWWWQHIAIIVNILAIAPFLAAYAYALCLLLQGHRAGATTLFRPFRSAALWANTTLAGFAALLVSWLVRWLWWQVPLQPGFLDENSPLDRAFHLIPIPEWVIVIADIPKWVGILLTVPLAWSALNVLVPGTSGFRAITQSVRLARRHWHLAAIYLAAAVLLPLAHWVCAPLLDLADREKGVVLEFVFGLSGFCNFLVSSIVLLLETLVLVLVYREMLWRERETQRPRFDLARRPEPVEGPLDSPASAP